jgi:hypothetical protein
MDTLLAQNFGTVWERTFRRLHQSWITAPRDVDTISL